MRAGWLRAALFGMASALAASASCATEVVDPAPVVGGAGGGTSSSGQGGSGGGITPRRAVFSRNPYGNVAVSDNLLWDGDFEWLSSFSDQYAWLTGPNESALGYDLPKQVVGAACKSGLKCIELRKGAIALGTGVASTGHPLEAWVYAAVDGDCSGVEVILASYGQSDPDVVLAPTGREAGWCKYHGTTPERKHAIALYVHNATSGAVRIDDAVVRPAPSAALSLPTATPSGRDLDSVKRELRRRAKPSPRPRAPREHALVREVERRRQQ